MKFIGWLESLNEKDTKVRAVLRRSLAFDPGNFVPAYPYVEPFLKHEENSRQRGVFYLVAGLWASHWRKGRGGVPVSLGKACAAYKTSSRSTNTERRFIGLLDADHEQLPHHMRQMIALLKDQTIDFDELLESLLFWDDDQKRSQNGWARDFYRSQSNQTDTVQAADKEISE